MKELQWVGYQMSSVNSSYIEFDWSTCPIITSLVLDVSIVYKGLRCTQESYHQESQNLQVNIKRSVLNYGEEMQHKSKSYQEKNRGDEGEMKNVQAHGLSLCILIVMWHH